MNFFFGFHRDGLNLKLQGVEWSFET